MTSTTALFYTDEDMSALVATLLRARGLDVTTVPEQSTLGLSDQKQLAFAISIERCLLTHNRVDFEILHLEYVTNDQQHYGIIVIPQQNAYKVAKRIGILAEALSFEDMKNQLLYA